MRTLASSEVTEEYKNYHRVRIKGGKWGWLGLGGVIGGKIETTVLEQQ